MARCLGRAPPTYRARSMLKKQIDTLAREHRKLMERADYVREQKPQAEDDGERKILEETAEEYEELAYKHYRGWQGLHGE